jgi:exosortase
MSDVEGTTTGHELHASARRGAARVGTSVQEMVGLAVLAGIMVPGLREMAAVWSRLDYYSHGYMIPFVALWAASAQRHVLPQLPRSRDGRGAMLIVTSLAAYLLGLAAGLLWLAGVAMVAVVAGAVLYARGPVWLRTLAFPIGYLLFMVPVPDAWLAPLIVRLQLLVSSAGTALLHVFGQPVLRVGNVLQLPSGEELFVAEACSGITSLITLVPLGVFLAYFVERGFWRRSLLVLTVVPVALAGNLVRVLLTVAVAGEWGAEAATESSLHVWVGLSTYVLACLVLLGVGGWMRRSWPPAPAS